MRHFPLEGSGVWRAVNCSAIPETLLESELFGHVEGAFTGAVRDKIGVFQAAHGGTLFLDEAGDMSLLLQLKLLRVLQERDIHRVGDDRPIKVAVRLVTTTNKEIKILLASSAMREDFYYRIRVFEIVLPSLRDRREDIPLLVEHFIGELAQVHGKRVKGIARDALQRILEYPWPGNLRELKNAIEHAFVTVMGDRITLLDLPSEVRTSMSRTAKAPSKARLTSHEQAERQRILSALDKAGGNRSQA